MYGFRIYEIDNLQRLVLYNLDTKKMHPSLVPWKQAKLCLTSEMHEDFNAKDDQSQSAKDPEVSVINEMQRDLRIKNIHLLTFLG